MFVLGLDLGQAQDPSAIGIVEGREVELHLRYLERLPLGTPYPAVVEHVSGLVQALPARSALVVDAGGPGRPVVDLMRERGLAPKAASRRTHNAAATDESCRSPFFHRLSG